MPELSQLEELRETTAAYLRGLAAFDGVAVVTRKAGDVVNAIHNNVAATGVSAELFIKSAKPTSGQSFTVVFDPVVISLTIHEQVLVNQDPLTGTGKGAFYLIEAALVALKMWMPPGFANVFMPDAAGPQYGQPKASTMLILTQDFSTTLQLSKRSL